MPDNTEVVPDLDGWHIRNSTHHGILSVSTRSLYGGLVRLTIEHILDAAGEDGWTWNVRYGRNSVSGGYPTRSWQDARAQLAARLDDYGVHVWAALHEVPKPLDLVGTVTP